MKEVISLFLAQANKLEQEEHVNDLAIHGCFELLKGIRINVFPELVRFLQHGNGFDLKATQIPEELYLVTAMLIREYGKQAKIQYDDSSFFKNDTEKEKFAHSLANKYATIGKSVAWCMLSSTYLVDMKDREFFTDIYAECYQEEFETSII